MRAAGQPERGDGTATSPGTARRAAGKTLPLFLHRDTYRRRRVMDAARLLPAFGAALLLLPVLWDDSHTTASGAVYLFAAWAVLILCAVVLARRLAAPLRQRAGPPDPAGAVRDAGGEAGAGDGGNVGA